MHVFFVSILGSESESYPVLLLLKRDIPLTVIVIISIPYSESSTQPRCPVARLPLYGIHKLPCNSPICLFRRVKFVEPVRSFPSIQNSIFSTRVLFETYHRKLSTAVPVAIVQLATPLIIGQENTAPVVFRGAVPFR